MTVTEFYDCLKKLFLRYKQIQMFHKIRIIYYSKLREGTFFIGAGALEGRVISKYFTHWGGSNLFDTQPG